MIGNAFIYSNPWLPNDLWVTIASFLDNDDLAKFRQLCKVAQFIGSHDVILQPLYNRLYAMDKTLAAALPQEGALPAFKQAFEKIQAQQQREIAYLTKHHRFLMATAECTQVFQENTAVSLQSLEAKNKALDKINSEIIQEKIDVNSTELDLDKAHITRLPVSLFQAEGYVNFWQNLTRLYCRDNQLTTLNVQGLLALQTLDCESNQLTALDVQGLAALQRLNCDNNPLMALNLTGVHASTKNQYAEVERSLLFKQLSQADCDEVRQEIIVRLGADYTYTNCLHYCPVYATKVFAFDSANCVYGLVSTVLSKAFTYLPSFDGNNNTPEDADLKRKRNEDAMRIDLAEESDDEPDLKRIKKS